MPVPIPRVRSVLKALRAVNHPAGRTCQLPKNSPQITYTADRAAAGLPQQHSSQQQRLGGHRQVPHGSGAIGHSATKLGPRTMCPRGRRRWAAHTHVHAWVLCMAFCAWALHAFLCALCACLWMHLCMCSLHGPRSGISYECVFVCVCMGLGL